MHKESENAKVRTANLDLDLDLLFFSTKNMLLQNFIITKKALELMKARRIADI